MLKSILKPVICFLPWRIRRIILIKLFKYEIHQTATIGFAWVYPRYLKMAAHTRISNFSVVIHVDVVELRQNSGIGRQNWITGFSTKTKSQHYIHQINERKSELILGEHSYITKNHHIDCTNQIIIGKFVTIAGYNSQFLTHSINIYKNCQDSEAIVIGDYCFIGTNVVVLGGAKLPSYSILGAKSMLNKQFDEEFFLYAGSPAKPIQEIDKNAKYFNRKDGFVF